jgi:hypothetical protein
MKEGEASEDGKPNPGERNRNASNVVDAVLNPKKDIPQTYILSWSNAREAWQEWRVGIGDCKSNHHSHRHQLVWVVVNDVDNFWVKSGVAGNSQSEAGDSMRRAEVKEGHVDG